MPPVAFPNIDFNSLAVTPNRKTAITFGLPEYRRTRQSWGQNFRGRQMASDSGQPGGHNLNVTLLPSGSWCITSWEMSMQFELSAATGNLILGPGFTPVVDFALASPSGAPAVETFVSQSQIPGVTYDPGVVPLGCYWGRKRKKAADDWHAELTGDLAEGSGGMIKPAFPTQNAEMRRLAKQQGTNNPNCSCYLRFLGPGAPLSTTDAFLTFYWGGDTVTTWAAPGDTSSGGAFCLTLFGDGGAWLQEHTGHTGGVFDPTAPWRIVDTWQWEVRGKIANQQHVIIIIPEGRDTLNFLGTGRQHLFIANSRSAGYTGKAAMTGTGRLRLDMREDLRLPFQFGSNTFRPGGTSGTDTGTALYGYPFKIPYRMAAGTKIFAEKDQPPNIGGTTGAIDIRIFDAKTNVDLGAPAGDGSFSTVTTSQRDYYPRYTPQRGSAFDTPFLRGCNFRVEGVTALYTPATYTGGQVLEVAITGPDLEVDCETANVLIEDDQAALADGPAGQGGLDRHADHHAQIRTTWSATDATKQWILFDGIVVGAPAVRQGKIPGFGATSTRWKQIRLQLAGQWKRLTEPWQFMWQSKDWTRDPSGAVDSFGQPLPWQIIDIVAEALKQAGYDGTQIHLRNPDGSTTGGPRLYADGKNPQNHWIGPAVRIADLIQHMCKDYLGGRLIWDKEAVPARWIIVYPPVLNGTYTGLFTFRTQGPPGTSSLPIHLPQAYPTGTTFVTNYTTWVTPPEANLFVVATAPGAQLPAHDPRAAPGQDIRYVKDGGTLSMAVGVNWRSTQFDGYPAPDPNSLDFIPYGIKPSITIDPALWTGSVESSNEACRFVCRRKMMLGAYGLKHFQWLAPLIGYMDPDSAYAGGPRAFRTYDVVTFNEDGTLYNVMLTSCNPQIGLPEGDMAQWAEYSGFALPVPLSY